MAPTLAQPSAGSSQIDSTDLPGPTSHQLSKRQQYDTLLHAEVDATLTPSIASPASHPSYPAVAPLCRQYPTQASAIFQAYLDLKNGAAAWDIVEPLNLAPASQSRSLAPEGVIGKDLSALSDHEADALVSQTLGRWKSRVNRSGLVNRSTSNSGDDNDELLETGIAAIKGRRKDAKTYETVIPLTITQHLRASQLSAIFKLMEQHAASCPADEHLDTSHLLLAIIAPDSTLVYYTVSQGMVKPIN